MSDTPANPPAGAPANAPAPTQAPNANPPAGSPQPTQAPGSGDSTIANSGGDQRAAAAPADFPADWRKKLGGEDAKELQRLERFGSPVDVYKAYRALEQKLSSGELVAKNPLPANPTAEQLTAYRAANGIPETPDKYDTKLSDGLIIGENDKPIVDDYLKYAHDKNLTPAQVKDNMEWYFKTQQALMAQNLEADKEFRGKAEDEMRTEWGADFKGNNAGIKAMLEGVGEDALNSILGGRTPDGRLMGDDPTVLRALNQLARELNPTGVITPNTNGTQVQDIEKEMKTLEGKMGTTAYGQAERNRYTELETMMEKVRKKTSS